MPVIAIVVARLMKNDKYYGLRPFLVQLGDGKRCARALFQSMSPYAHY